LGVEKPVIRQGGRLKVGVSSADICPERSLGRYPKLGRAPMVHNIEQYAKLRNGKLTGNDGGIL
jgi:hypothetical protein